MPLFPITDDRARPVRLYGPRDDLPRSAARDSVPADVRRRIDVRLRRPLSTAQWINALAITFGCLWLSTELVPVLLTSGMSAYAWAPLVLVANLLVCVAGALVYRWFVHRMYTPQIVAAFLADHRCPGCGYDMTALAPASDACTVCPECGAAWRLHHAPGARPS